MFESKRIDDGERDALEDQLRSTMVPTSPELRDRLFYHCGVSAGRRDARRRTYRWTAAAVALGILVGGLAVGGLGNGMTPKPAGDIATAPAGSVGPRSAISKSSTIRTGSESTDDSGQFRPRAVVQTEAGKLTTGIRWDQALALIDGPAPVFEPTVVPQNSVERPPLRPTWGFFQ